ncbi:TR11B-like protein [Mya arenaria]|uniref:TR11B-like protein n=1 Tax=Mya arenaria TaxID=6604 RepID=A0ABY7EXJ2_MYAAR|nr:TR11B-like protein [Mya arenaria]
MDTLASGFECPPEAKQLYYKVGENKECMKCSPGYYWLHHCIFNLTNAVCTPCPKGSYSPCNNIALACERCDTHCPGFSNQDAYKDREYISEACTAISNIKCSCRQSYYKESGEDGMCTEKQPCPPGSGVLRQVSVDANSPKGDSTVTIVAILATSAIVIVAIIVGRWPSRRPTNKELGTIADCFTGDYQILATQLEVSPERVYRIQRDHNQDIHSQVFAVLLDWANATAAPTLADLETEMRNVESLKFNWVNANKKLNVEQYDISNAQL